MKIYHNSRCSKSRYTLKILKDQNISFEIINYLENNLSENEIESILEKLNIQAIELVRKNEKLWKEKYKNKQLTSKQIIKILHENPKLIERPIVINELKGVIGRPPENVYDLLD